MECSCFGPILGRGISSTVRQAVMKSKSAETTVAVKLFKKRPKAEIAYKVESKALNMIEHKHVVRKLDGGKCGNKFGEEKLHSGAGHYLILPLARTDMLSVVMKNGALSEALARTLFHQIIDGLEACHLAGVAHRDIKLENLLVDMEYCIRISDFGFASTSKEKDAFSMTSRVGTVGYMAPEIVERKGNYTEACDLWSAAVCLFVMIAGYPPYRRPNKRDKWFQLLIQGKFKEFWAAHDRFATISEDAKDVLEAMFNSDPECRANIKKLRTMKWMKAPQLGAELREHMEKRCS